MTRVIPRPLPGRDDDIFWSYLAAGEIRHPAVPGLRAVALPARSRL